MMGGGLPGRLAIWFTGCVLFSIGVKLFIDSALGADPLHAMILGIVGLINVPFIRVGVVELMVVFVSLAIWCRWNRALPVPVVASVFLTMGLVGFLIDGWNALGLERFTERLGPRAVLGIGGLILDAYASALIIMSGFGLRNMDLLAVSITRKWGWPFLAAKMFLEAVFVVVALMTHGPVGIITLVFVPIVGGLIQPLMALNERALGLQNIGLPSARTHVGAHRSLPSPDLP